MQDIENWLSASTGKVSEDSPEQEPPTIFVKGAEFFSTDTLEPEHSHKVKLNSAFGLISF